MRYTTIIDISQMPILYKNLNVRLIYLHLCLTAGYHDYDRDLVDISLRRLAAEVGITFSAARHALGILQKARLIEQDKNIIKVKKFLFDAPITQRAKTAKAELLQQAIKTIKQQQSAEQKEREQREADYQAVLAQGKTPYMLYYEDLMRKAQAGDLQAAELVRRNKTTYEEHARAIKEQQNKK